MDDTLPLTIPALCRRQARKYGDRTMLVCDAERLTYAEADLRSRRLARGLLRAGVTKGSHVALLFPNGVDFVVCALAVMRLGAVLVPLSTLSSADELRTLLIQSDTSFLLAASGYRGRDYGELVKAALPDLDFARPPPARSLAAPWLKGVWFRGGGDTQSSMDSLEAAASDIDEAYLEAVEARVQPSDRGVIIHTSGSTGIPKGVMHTHGSLIQHRANILERKHYGEDEILYSPAPWFWVTGFSFSLLGTLIAGARIVHSNATKASEVLDFIERERPTITNGYVQTVAWLAADPSITNRDFSSVRRGTLLPLMAREVRPADPALRHEAYGMTEGGSAVTTSGDDGDLPEDLRGSCGPFLPGFEPRIVNPETGEVCAIGTPGELWLRGPLMMEGYYGKPRREVFDKDGWWRTGDIGVIDVNGFFFLKGRLSNMIKTAGANVAPREVESVLRGLTDGLPCIVLGVPDARRGQAVGAVVITDRTNDVDEAHLREQLGIKLSNFKVPRRILAFSQSEIPVLSNGKVDMPRLTALVQSRW